MNFKKYFKVCFKYFKDISVIWLSDYVFSMYYVYTYISALTSFFL